METQINLFFWSGIAFIALCAMMVFAKANNRIWKSAIYVGMGASGFAMVGYIAPVTNPFPNECFVIGLAVMLSAIAYNYYRNPIPDMTAEAIERRHKGLKFVCIGFFVILFFTIVAAYTKSNQTETKAQIHYNNTLDNLSDLVGVIAARQMRFMHRLENVEKNQEEKARADSARFKETIRKLNGKK